MVYSGAWGNLIHEKNQKSKISWHCPFKRYQNAKLIIIESIALIKKSKTFGYKWIKSWSSTISFASDHSTVSVSLLLLKAIFRQDTSWSQILQAIIRQYQFLW